VKKKRKKKKKKETHWHWPGVRRFVKEWTVPELVDFVTACFTVISEGGFWLHPHAHAEFAQEQVRASNEQSESVLMFEVFKFVTTKLAEERKDEPPDECVYQNFYTSKENVAAVKAVFSNPQDTNCTWITVDPQLCMLGLGYSATNILVHLSKLRQHVDTADHEKFDEQVVNVQKLMMDMVQFLHRLQGQEGLACGDQGGITLSQTQSSVEVAPTRKRKTKKSCEHKSDASDAKSSTLATIRGGSPSSLGGTHSKVSEEGPASLPSSTDCETFRRTILEIGSGSFVLVVNRCYVPYGASWQSETLPSTRLFAVFSTEDSCGQKVPSVVFPCLSTRTNDKVEYRVHDAVFFNQEKPSSECWIFLNADVVKDRKRVNCERAFFWFDGGTEQKAAADVLSSPAFVSKFEESERMSEILGKGLVDTFQAMWMIETDPAGGKDPHVFEAGLPAAQKVIFIILLQINLLFKKFCCK